MVTEYVQPAPRKRIIRLAQRTRMIRPARQVRIIMERTQLPEEFLEDMKAILGDEYEAFVSSYDKPARKGLRINGMKVYSKEELKQRSGFHLTPVPWTANGFFYEEGDQPSRHPYYSAGLYYLQEPSAMAPAQILPVCPGDRVLDLCAAPGGKTTELGSRLDGKGLLVANEISPSRVKALVRNVELFGIPNAVITNTSPAKLLEHYPRFFDKILVDAPCSGEGMFRKDEGAVRTWTPEKVKECASIQREIITEAADMLKAGGYMVYSTCTFAPEENELTILHLLRERPDMELIDIPRTGGRTDFSAGLSVTMLGRLGYLDGCGQNNIGNPDAADLTMCCRLWPHKIEGEGHFVALLRKKGFSPEAGSKTGHAEKGKKLKKGKCRGLAPEDLNLIRNFIYPYLYDSGISFQEENLEIHDGKVYLMPEGVSVAHGVTTVRAGVYLGELKKNRFEPEQELAMILPCAPKLHISGENGTPDTIASGLQPREDGQDRGIPGLKLPEDWQDRYVCLPPEDERIEKYLHGEVIPVQQSGPNGWRLLCADRSPVGWGKLVNGQLKNKYPAGWRIPG